MQLLEISLEKKVPMLIGKKRKSLCTIDSLAQEQESVKRILSHQSKQDSRRTKGSSGHFFGCLLNIFLYQGW